MSKQQEIDIVPACSESEDVVVEWVAVWDDVEIRKVGITFKLGDSYVRCDKRFYSELFPDSP